MQRIYQVDLCDVWRGTLTLRKLRVLIEHLPGDCASARAIAGVDDELSQWTLTNALLARMTDEIAVLRWQWESAHLAKNQRHRPQPKSVLPDTSHRAASSQDADVIPLVSPHKLGGFINEANREDRNGD